MSNRPRVPGQNKTPAGIRKPSTLSISKKKLPTITTALTACEGASPWTRIEVEWRAQDRFIPFDILTRPGHYQAGAYPCLEFLTEEQSTIKTIAKAGQIAYDTAVENAKRYCGKTVTLMLDVLGGDYGEVVNTLMRPG